MALELSREESIEKFFAIARERYEIRLKRLQGLPKPWTDNEIFKTNRFCNVFREHDRTTEWFRENIRDELRDEPIEALCAIVAFRWFNKIETGEILKFLLLGFWNSDRARDKLVGRSPVVTGAYIIKTPDGKNKLDGVLWCIDQFIERVKKGELAEIISGESSHENAQRLLEKSPFLGRFMAYQIIADARYTKLLDKAPDINTWAQPGPGSTRGIGRIFYGEVDKFRYGSVSDEREVIKLMQELREYSTNRYFWPEYWPEWEMQVVQNWCCETDKYYRCEEGGRMKRKFP